MIRLFLWFPTNRLIIMPSDRNQTAGPGSTSDVYPGRGRLAKARQEFEARLAQTDQPTIRLEYAEVLADSGDSSEAIRQCEQVLRSTDFCGTSQVKAVAFNQLACLYRQRGEFAKAKAYQRRSLALEIDYSIDGDVAVDLGNLAADAIAAGDLSHAKALLRRSLSLEIAANSLSGQAADLGNLAIAHALDGDQIAAVKCLRRSLKIHRQLEDIPAVGCDLMNLAAIYQSLQRWQRCHKLLSLAVRVFQLAEATELSARAKTAMTEARRNGGLCGFDATRN